MQHKNLLEMLGNQGLGKEGDAWLVPAGVAATIYLALDEEALIIDRVSKLEIHSDWAIVMTLRRERYAVELGTIRALRFVAEK